MKELRGKGPGILAGDARLVISPDHVGDTIAVQFSEPSGTRFPWKIFVRVNTPEGDYNLGGVTTRPPYSGGDPANRVILLASHPGATGWRVMCFGPDRSIARLSISTRRMATGGSFGIIPVNGSRLMRQVWDAPVSPIVPAAQGILTNGPGTIYGLYGFTDPATPAGYFGLVDKSSAIVAGDVWRVAPVPVGGAGVADRISFSFNPDGVDFANQARWVLSSTLGTVTPLVGGGAVVQGVRV